jgi:DNA-binding transcriptional LysR family regulator
MKGFTVKLDHLLHFAETARHEHLTKAAAVLRLSPSAISYSIACLEEELGVALFEKRGKRIFLTQAGRRLHKKIPDVQRSLADLRSHVSVDAPAFEGHYRVGATHLLAEAVLAPAMGRLFGASRAVSADVFSLRSAEVIGRVLDESLDLGICFSPQNHPRLRIQTLGSGTLKVYVRAKHPLLKKNKAIGDLSRYTAVLPKAFGGIDICETHEVFQAHGISPQSRFSFDHYGVGCALVEQSDGWGFFPDWLESLPRFALRAVPLPKPWKAPFTISAVTLKDRFTDPGLERLLSAVSVR